MVGSVLPEKFPRNADVGMLTRMFIGFDCNDGTMTMNTIDIVHVLTYLRSHFSSVLFPFFLFP